MYGCEQEFAPIWVKLFVFMALIGAPVILTVIILVLSKLKKMGIYKGE
ncbi:TMhelix containing protein [Vibrio phage 1.071.A._10N.286.46.A12]|nr:TMhelix containing protein [Vibrio phage 1.071.A._10N.286.46.A12]